MDRDILVPLDGSDPSWQALEFAFDHHAEADVTVYYVINVASAVSETAMGTTSKYDQELYEAREEHAESVLSDAERFAERYGEDVETEHVRGLPREAILEYADGHPVDQIIMGSHGRSGLERVVIGSVAEKVARHADVPVTIVPPDET